MTTEITKNKIALFLIAVFVVIGGCVSPSTESKVTVEETKEGGTLTTTETPTFETVEYKDENMTGTITKNLLTKTATVTLRNELPVGEPTGGSFDNFTILGPLFGCRVVSILMFDQEALDEWNASLKELNPEQEGPAIDRSNHPLWNSTIGYNVTRIDMDIINKNTGEKVSTCISTGKGKENNEITFYGAYTEVYENLKNSDDNSFGNVTDFFKD